MNLLLIIFIFFSIFSFNSCYFWRTDEDEAQKRSLTKTNVPSNLGCFICTQLLSVTKHRVGLSENQLRNQLYAKCRVLPSVFKDQCFTFVESSLPDIYYSINYDLSSKDVCVNLNFCDESNPFAVGGPLPEIREEKSESNSAISTTISEEIFETTISPTTTTTTKQIEPMEPIGKEEYSDRIGHRNVLEIILPQSMRNKYISRNSIIENEKKLITTTERIEIDDKRLTCSFCERMLENAKNYAVTSKMDISSFANSACSSIPKGRNADQCYQMADKKISDLAKFVDQQVVEALWCAELNQC